jgi:hypothetical protein
VTAEGLLLELERRGVVLFAEGGRLCYRAPKGALTDELRRLAGERRPELLALLTAWPEADGAELVAWFAALPWPCGPFALAPWRQVTDPELFCRTLAEDIARGPRGPHVHHGHVLSDLRALRQVIPKAPRPAG